MASKCENSNFYSLWHDFIHCSNCYGIVELHKGICPICKHNHIKNARHIEIPREGGMVEKIPQISLMGAIPYTVYSLLILIQNEWERPKLNTFSDLEDSRKPSEKLVIVILFWSLFESLMEEFFEDSMKEFPKNIKTDLLKRYFSISIRMDRLYPILHDSKFKKDFTKVGNENITKFIEKVHKARNEFIHGQPEKITDKLVNETIKMLEPVQKVWIALYNLKCVRYDI